MGRTLVKKCTKKKIVLFWGDLKLEPFLKGMNFARFNFSSEDSMLVQSFRERRLPRACFKVGKGKNLICYSIGSQICHDNEYCFENPKFLLARPTPDM